MSDYSLVTEPNSYTGNMQYKPDDLLQYDVKIIRGDVRQRNAKMRACVQVYCKNAADTLNIKNVEQVVSLMSVGGKAVEIRRPWCEESFKFSVFQETLLGVTEGRTRHTSKATNKELCEVDKLIAQLLSENFGIELTWPSSSPPIWESYNES